ncbi:MAG: FtsX-like permease family protein [Finegoldia sp.]|nr:FtsX-like permease family protein [Finegoldia sp.]
MKGTEKKSKIPVYWKDNLRAITKNKKRFFAILAMTMLGAMVFVGLVSSGPNFRRAVDISVEKTNRDQVRVSSVLGLYPEDREILENLDGLKDIEYLYKGNFLLGDSKEDVIQVQSLTKKISKPLVVEGKLPEKRGQILLDLKARDKLGLKVGDRLSIKANKTEKNDESDDKEGIAFESPVEENLLKSENFEVVGFATHIDYMVESGYGPVNMGDGNIKYFGLVVPDDFDKERFDAALLKVDGLDGLIPSSKDYKLKEQKIVSEIEEKLSKRPGLITKDLKADANSSIKDAENEIKDARDQLAEGEKELKDARENLDSSWEDFKDGRDEFDSQIRAGQDELDAASQKLADAKAVLDSGQAAYDKGLFKYEEGLAKAESSQSLLSESLERLKLATDKLYIAKKELSDKGINQNFIASTHQKLDSAKEKFAALSNDLDRLSNDPTYAKEFVRNQIIGLESEKADLLKKRAGIESEVKALEDEMSLLKEQIKDLEDKKDKLESYAGPESNFQDENKANDTSNESLENKNDTNNNIEEIQNLDQGKQDDQDHQEENKIRPPREEVIVEIKEKSEVKALFKVDETDIEKVDKDLAVLKEKLAEKNSAYQEKLKSLEEVKVSLAENDQLLSGLGNPETMTSSIGAMKEDLAAKKAEVALLEAEVQKAEGALYEVNKAEAEIKNGWAAYDSGLAAYKNGLVALEKTADQLRASSETLSGGFAAYNKGIDELKSGERALEDAREEGLAKLDDAESKLNEGEQEYKDGLETFNEESKDAEKEIADGEEKIRTAREDVEEIKVPAYTVSGLYGDFVIRNVVESSNNMDTLTLIFPVIFYLVAMLTTLTTITRMVDEERSQIGSKKALGMSKWSIMSKYLFYAISPSVIGTVIGLVLGFKILMPVIFDAYMGDVKFIVPLDHKLFVSHIIIALLVGVGVNLFSAWWSLHKDLKEVAANLMRPKPPANGNRILVERIDPIWKRLSFTQKVTFRNLTAKKSRMFMTLLGVLSGTSLIIMGFGLRNSINQLIDKQFGQIDKYNMKIVYNPDGEKEEIEQLKKYLDDKSDSYTILHTETAKFENKKGINESFNLEVPTDMDTYLKIRGIKDKKSREKISLTNDKALISDTMARMVKEDERESLKIKDMDGYQEEVGIGASFEQYIQHAMVMSEPMYEKVFDKKAEDNTFYVNLNEGVSADQVKNDLLSIDSVLYVINAGRGGDEIDNFKNSIDVIVRIISLVSALLAFVVLSNLTNLNVSERQKEISTIKVLGFHSKEVTEYIYKETFILTVIGLVIGCLTGKLLHYVICTALSPSNIILDPELKLSAYLYGVGIILLFSLIVMVLVHRQLQKIDMVEALKADE